MREIDADCAHFPVSLTEIDWICYLPVLGCSG